MVAEGFKLLDAYVEVTADTSNIGRQMVKGIDDAAPAVKASAEKLAATVASASDRVTSARKREADAAGALRLAGIRLNELRKTEAADSIRLITAEERFAAAQRNSTAAMDASKRAATELSSAEQRLQASTLQAANTIERTGSDRLRKSGSRLGESLMGGLKGFAVGAVAGVVAGITAPLTQGVGAAIEAVTTTAKAAIFDYNAKLEQANIGFETMLGSAAKAKTFLGDLQKFAASTPFEFEDLTRASQRLLAMGVEAKDVIPYMTGIGDAVAGLGGGADLVNQVTLALGQMTAKGKVQGDDLMQLTEAGIPALKILADTYGTTTSEMTDMISEGKILSDKAVPAIIRGLEKGTKTTSGFGGMMEKQSKTMTGSLSNISDSVNQTLSSAFLPLFKGVERAAGGLAKFAGSRQVQRWAKDTAKDVGQFIDMFEDGFKKVLGDPEVQKAGRELFASLRNGMRQVRPALKQILPDLIDFGREVLPVLVRSVQKVTDKIPALLAWWRRLAGGLKAAGPVIADVIGFLSDLGSMLFDLSRWLGNAVADWIEAFFRFRKDSTDTIVKFIDWLATAGSKMVTAVVNGILGEGNPIAAALSGLVAQAASAVSGQLAALQAAVGGSGGWSGGGGSFSKSAISESRRDAAAAARGSTGYVGLAGAARSTAMPAFDLSGAGGGSGGGGSSGGGGGKKDKGEKESLKEIYASFRKYGKQVAAGLKKGLLGSASDIRDAGKAMRESVRDAFDAKYIGKGREKEMLAEITRVTERLVGLAKRREDIVEKLKVQKDKLVDLQDQRKSFKEGIRSSLFGAGDVTGLFEAGTSETTSSTAAAGSLDGRNYQASYTTSTTVTKEGGLTGVRQKLRQLVKDTRAFRTNLKTLVGKGLDRFTIQQLLQAGPTVGLPITTDLLTDKSAFDDIVHLQGELDTAGGALGEFGAGYTYDGDIAETQSRIDRLRDRRDTINVTMVIEAKKIDEVSKVVSAVNAAAKTAKAKKGVKK